MPAVWHKEILWAIGQGVHVFGAASMGALRAAELAPFGMRGVGRIFEAYRDGRFTASTTTRSRTTTRWPSCTGRRRAAISAHPRRWSNIRCTLARAVTEGVIAEATRRALVAEAKAAFFPDRGYAALLAQGRAGGLPEAELAALERWLPAGRVDQKRLDAVAMLEAMRDFLAADPPPARADFTFERTTYWKRAEAAFQASRRPSPAACWRLCGSTPADCERLGEDELRDWYFARVAGTAVPADLGGWMRDAGYADRGRLPPRRVRRVPRAGSRRGAGRPLVSAILGRHLPPRRTRTRTAPASASIRRRPSAPSGSSPRSSGSPRPPARCGPGPPTIACTWPTRSTRIGPTTRRTCRPTAAP